MTPLTEKKGLMVFAAKPAVTCTSIFEQIHRECILFHLENDLGCLESLSYVVNGLGPFYLHS